MTSVSGRSSAASLSIIASALRQREHFGWQALRRQYLLDAQLQSPILVDYSSPNVAKPFHAGHLRATLLGAFVCRAHKSVGADVVGINYGGDWGRQFGLLALGLRSDVTEDCTALRALVMRAGAEDVAPGAVDAEEAAGAVRRLVAVYGAAHTALSEARLSSDAVSHATRLLDLSQQRGCAVAPEQAAELAQLRGVWRGCRRLTLAQWRAAYGRLGVRFDAYEFESEQVADTARVLAAARAAGLLQSDAAGRLVVPLPAGAAGPAVLLKSCGSSLYLTRDVAAALSRRRRYGHGRALYVTEAAQSEHFRALQHIVTGVAGVDAPCLEHVPFGRVLGMSSRRGAKLLLDDALDAAAAVMRSRLAAKRSTRVADGPRRAAVAERLGVTLLTLEALHAPRCATVRFNWARSELGVKLHYCHARLCSLFARAAGLEQRTAGCVALLMEPGEAQRLLLPEDQPAEAAAVLNLVQQLQNFETVLASSVEQLEPYLLVRYAEELVALTNLCVKLLPVLRCPDVMQAGARLALLQAAQLTLENSTACLGIDLLEEM